MRGKILNDIDVGAIFVAVIFLLVGLGLSWFAVNYLSLSGEALQVTIFVLPILIYAIASGKLERFKGPGGIEAAFVSESKAQIDAAIEKIEANEDDFVQVEKGGLSILEEQLGHLDESRPIILTITLGRSGYYSREGMKKYIEGLSQFRAFKFVVFLDKDKRFVAYTPSWAFRQILDLEIGYEFADILNSGNVRRLKLYPSIVDSTVTATASKAEALTEMQRRNLEALVVIDDNRRVKGVVERDQIISSLLLSISRASA